ncbi:MAG: response regulator, partial [Pseudomonadota bacterium]
DMTGIELARRVAELRPGLPVVIASGMIDEDELQSSRPANVVTIVRKPYNAKTLHERLLQAVSTIADEDVA